MEYQKSEKKNEMKNSSKCNIIYYKQNRAKHTSQMKLL